MWLRCAPKNPQSGAISVDFDDTGFTVTPHGGRGKGDPPAVSAYVVRKFPFILFEPGGHLDVTQATYTDDVAVPVTGSNRVPSGTYAVKTRRRADGRLSDDLMACCATPLRGQSTNLVR
jgi:hypothetical protein